MKNYVAPKHLRMPYYLFSREFTHDLPILALILAVAFVLSAAGMFGLFPLLEMLFNWQPYLLPILTLDAMLIILGCYIIAYLRRKRQNA
jgi:hypothetical protein